jgi:hypothetical protein
MSSDSGEVLDCKTSSFLHPARAVGNRLESDRTAGCSREGEKGDFISLTPPSSQATVS